MINYLSYNNLVNYKRISTYKDMISNHYDEIHNKLFELSNKAAYESFIEAYSADDYFDNDELNNRQKNIMRLVKSGLIDTYDKFKKYVNIIEVKNLDYDLPSSVIWRTKTYPFIILSVSESTIKLKPKDFWKGSQGTMSLSAWWIPSINQLKNKNVINNFSKNISGYEITYIDYVRDKVTLYNKLNDSRMNVQLNDINSDTPLSEEYALENRFTKLYI